MTKSNKKNTRKSGGAKAAGVSSAAKKRKSNQQKCSAAAKKRKKRRKTKTANATAEKQRIKEMKNITRQASATAKAIERLLCPLSGSSPVLVQLPVSPVIAEDGRTYNMFSILAYIAECRHEKRPLKSPTTEESMGPSLLPAPHVSDSIRRLVEQWLELEQRYNDLHSSSSPLKQPELTRPTFSEDMAAWKSFDDLKAKAEGGDPKSMYDLGKLYQADDESYGVLIDAKLSYHWISRAASLDYDDAVAEQGVMLYNGVGVEQDQTSGAALLGVAAERGNYLARITLVREYYVEKGRLQRNVSLAQHWMQKIVDKGKDASFKDADALTAIKRGDPIESIYISRMTAGDGKIYNFCKEEWGVQNHLHLVRKYPDWPRNCLDEEELDGIGEKTGWTKMKGLPFLPPMASYCKDGMLLKFWLTTRTVGSYIDHPRRGKSQLFNQEITMEEADQLFYNPRKHTGKGYHEKKEISTSTSSASNDKRTCAICGKSKSNDAFTKNQRRKGPASKCKACV